MTSSSGKLSRVRTPLRVALVIVGVIVALLVVQSLPIFLMMPFGAQAYDNPDFVVYYEKGDEAGAREVFDLVQSSMGELKQRMAYQTDSKLQIYVYKAQSSVWIRKYGLATMLIAPTWYIGDTVGGVVRIVSPDTPVRGNTHDTILGAVLHEIVHSINYHKNPRLSYFWDNGLATYLSGQKPSSVSYWSMPSLEDTHTENEIKFGNMGGYEYSYSYVEYLDAKYGWDKVIEYAAGGKTYEQVFGASEQQVYDGWAEYLKQ